MCINGDFTCLLNFKDEVHYIILHYITLHYIMLYIRLNTMPKTVMTFYLLVHYFVTLYKLHNLWIVQ
jgi:hypothetical protein